MAVIIVMEFIRTEIVTVVSPQQRVSFHHNSSNSDGNARTINDSSRHKQTLQETEMKLHSGLSTQKADREVHEES
jgi:hypothetical protein